MTMPEGGMRWLTVGAKDQPDLEITVMIPGRTRWTRSPRRS